MSAYRIVLTPAGIGTPDPVTVPWSAGYEAEDAVITAGTIYTQGTVSNPNGYAASGTKDVGSLNRPESQVDFRVTVPAGGTYTLRVLYGNQTDAPAQQVLSVDGTPAGAVDYPRTLNWTYRAAADKPVVLTAGTHTLTLAKGHGEVTLDRIELTAPSQPSTEYPATLADTQGTARYEYLDSAGHGAGSVVLSGSGQTTFDVYAPAAGYHEIKTDYVALGDAWLDAGTTRIGKLRPATRVFLVAGMNRITVTAGLLSTVFLRGLRVAASPDQTGLASYEAENAVLGGAARVADNPYASGGKAAGYIGTGAANTLTFQGVKTTRPGPHILIIHYANDERAGSGNYNTNVVSRTADITVNSGKAQRATFRNTYSWNQFWSLAVPVTLAAGDNTVTFSNSALYAPDIDRVELAPLS